MKNVTGVIRAVWCLVVLTYPTIQLADAAEFFCPAGDVTCLIAAINEANVIPGENVINLEPGSYTLQTIDNGPTFGGNGLPVIGSSIRIQATAEDLPTVIERDLNAPAFRIFEVSVGGELIRRCDDSKGRRFSAVFLLQCSCNTESRSNLA